MSVSDYDKTVHLESLVNELVGAHDLRDEDASAALNKGP